MAGGSATSSDRNTAFAHLIDPSRTWYSNRRLIILHAWLVLLLITSSTNGYDGSLLNSFQSMPLWNDYFNQPQGPTLGLLTAIQNIGSLAGLPFAPYLSDGIGRRPTIWIGALVMLVGVAVQSASRTIGMFIGARFLIGFGLTFAANAAPMLVVEISYPPYRAPLTSLYNSLWYSGNTIASWTSFGTSKINNEWCWRIPSIVQGFPSVLQVFLVLLAPESPRYLVAAGKEKAALHTLAYYHADGDENDALVQYEFEEIKAESGSTAKQHPARHHRVPGDMESDMGGWRLFHGGPPRSAPPVLDERGRDVVCFTMQTVCSAQYALHGNNAAAHAVIAFIFLFYAFYDVAFSPLIVSYTLEILPYSLRAKGLNVFSFAISIALIFNQYVNPIALKKIAWKYYIVYCCWLVFEFVFLYFFIVETKNHTLEETSALFDCEALQELQQATARVIAEVRHEAKDYDEKDKVSDV
ncbi:Lactose permease [Grifola frondosa]|uniref:Lactose permease n=1 Tax=Grifola frondosa TaxID=5627 RepID=A0A1C7LT95_GRIFR|nr:Lactose permease [Grifola frondosa]